MFHEHASKKYLRPDTHTDRVVALLDYLTIGKMVEISLLVFLLT